MPANDDPGANINGATIPRKGESGGFGAEHHPLQSLRAFRLFNNPVHGLSFRLDQAEAAAVCLQGAVEPHAEPCSEQQSTEAVSFAVPDLESLKLSKFRQGRCIDEAGGYGRTEQVGPQPAQV